MARVAGRQTERQASGLIVCVNLIIFYVLLNPGVVVC